MGGNIGATIAANIAASVGNTAAKRTAISHTIMNTVGVIFVLIIYPWFLQVIGWMVELSGLPDPNTIDLATTASTPAIQTSLLYSVCVMHTLFNVVITLIFVWFVPQFVKHINNIESPNYNYQTGVYYMDIVAELERMGDFIINVSEAIIKENLE